MDSVRLEESSVQGVQQAVRKRRIALTSEATVDTSSRIMLVDKAYFELLRTRTEIQGGFLSDDSVILFRCIKNQRYSL